MLYKLPFSPSMFLSGFRTLVLWSPIIWRLASPTQLVFLSIMFFPVRFTYLGININKMKHHDKHTQPVALLRWLVIISLAWNSTGNVRTVQTQPGWCGWTQATSKRDTNGSVVAGLWRFTILNDATEPGSVPTLDPTIFNIAYSLTMSHCFCFNTLYLWKREQADFKELKKKIY